MEVLDPKKYELDEDGYPREIVGAWSKDKYARLSRYIDISRAVRRKFTGKGKAGASYIELFCGPGRVRVRDTDEVTHASPLVAWMQSAATNTSFTQVHVADSSARLLDATVARLRAQSAPVNHELGPAQETVDRIIRKLDPSGLHVAFLDPYNLAALPFEVLQKLATLERMDILIHVSVQDLNRNLHRYMANDPSPLDSFAPNWRAHVEVGRSIENVRGQLFAYWRNLLATISMSTTEAAELVVGGNNQPLYWLAFAARHGRALEFWEKIRQAGEGRQQAMF